MTSKDTEDAVTFAYESLKQGKSTWRKREPSGYQEAVTWESILLSDTLYSGPIVEGSKISFRLRADEENGHPKLYDEEKGARLIEKARSGDYVAKFTLYAVAADYLEAERPLPDALREYLIEELRSEVNRRPKRRGRDPHAYHPRDFEVACIISNVIMLGFRPTKNRATEGVSACSIVTQALEKLGIHLSESAVEKIWERFSPKLR